MVSLGPAHAAGPWRPRLVLRSLTTFGLVIFGWLVGALLADSASADTARPAGDHPVATTERSTTERPQRVAELSRLRHSIGPITLAKPTEHIPDSDEEVSAQEAPAEEAPAAETPQATNSADAAKEAGAKPLESQPEQAEPARQEPAAEPRQDPAPRSGGAGLLGVVGAVTNTVTSTVTNTMTGLTDAVGSIVTGLPAIVAPPLLQGPLRVPIDAIVRPIEPGLGDHLIGLTPPTVTPQPSPVADGPVTPVVAPVATVATAPAAIVPVRKQTMGWSTTEANAATAYATRTTVDQDEPGSEDSPMLPFPNTPCAPAGHAPTAASGNDSGNSRGQQATLPSHPKADPPPLTAGEMRREAAEASYRPGMPVTSPD